jgi:two-component system nitrate/nitrite response regulator NarL
MSDERAIRVLLAACEPLLRSALETYLQLRPEFEVVGEAADTRELLIQAQACLPDTILIDWGGFDGSLEETVATLHQLEPRPSIIFLTVSLEADQATMAAGADAIASKSEPPKSLLTAIYRARLEGDE